ncbi:hypothetical protein BHE74_00036101 [Ensete ventricosum]|nr:hypothetical protein BHE74_00036101 [Ensete ventricosum]
MIVGRLKVAAKVEEQLDAKNAALIPNDRTPQDSIAGLIIVGDRPPWNSIGDAQDLGISFELLPLSRPDEEFNVSMFYADMIGLEGTDISQFLPSATENCVDDILLLLSITDYRLSSFTPLNFLHHTVVGTTTITIFAGFPSTIDNDSICLGTDLGDSCSIVVDVSRCRGIIVYLARSCPWCSSMVSIRDNKKGAPVARL